MNAQAECCPQFHPEGWEKKELKWEDKKFVKVRVRSVFHIPLNFSAVMTKNVALIEAAGARPDEMIVLSDENSIWGADVYISVTKEIPGAEMAAISGTFMTRVFEGPYKDIGGWCKEMTDYVKAEGKEIRKLFMYYTTCPKCAKKWKKNYVVLLAQI